MVKKFFFGDDPMGKRDKKSTAAGDASGRKKVFGLNASAFIQRKMAEQQAKEENKKDDKK